ncbi:MAG: aminotransferase class I/II-fold pyridoxal phosphate-dependent enzyme [bacterium]|nr:aminotransferase class I/II-fold pyridoxal phosphate-dependent enzyme [bacterium]
MKIQPSKLREWNTKFEFSTKINISDCSIYPLTLKELFLIAGKGAKKEFEKLSLGYTKTWGEDILRQEIAKTYQNIKADNILVTNGAIEAIFLIMNVLSNTGDEMISFFPNYQALFQIAKTCGVKIKWWKLDEKKYFSPDFNQLSRLITKDTKAIIINQPQVPTGFVFTKSDYLTLIKICRKCGLYLVSDEVCRWLYLDKSNGISPAVDLYDKAISIGDVSKSFGAGGLRIGWLASQNREILEKCIPLRGYTTMSNSAPSEYLATLILRNRKEILKSRLTTAEINYQLLDKFVRKNIDKISLIMPAGGVTVFPKLKLKINSLNFCKKLIEKKNTMLVPGTVYGMPKNLRLGFGCKTRLFRKGLAGLQQYLKSL